MNTRTLLAVLGLAAAAPSALLADTVTLKDGSVINGTITRIEGGAIHVTTTFAGALRIEQGQVASFSTDNPLFVKTNEGSAVLGQVQATDAGIRVAGTQGTLQVPVASVRTSWTQGSEDPEVAALRRRWTYEASADITGRSGNSDRFGSAVAFVAALVSPQDTLRFYADYRFSEENNSTTDDALRGGADYSSFFSEHVSWYVNTELGRDEVKDLELRARAGAGLGYSVIRKPGQTLTLRGGLGYRYETYRNDPSGALTVNSPALDLALLHAYTFRFGALSNSLSYSPAFEDFGNFVVFHDSSLTMPVGAGDFWLLRLGVSNEYTSEPGPGREELDTTYYTRLVLSWR
jgi:hypothetical protein